MSKNKKLTDYQNVLTVCGKPCCKTYLKISSLKFENYVF